MDDPLTPAKLLCPWDFLDKNTGVGCHFLLQRIFLPQGSNLNPLHWQVDSSLLSYQGFLAIFWVIPEAPLERHMLNAAQIINCTYYLSSLSQPQPHLTFTKNKYICVLLFMHLSTSVRGKQ